MLYGCTKLLSYLCNGKCCMTLGIGKANGKVFCLHHARVATATVPTNMDIFTSVVSSSICTWFREVTCQRVGNLFMFPKSLGAVCCLDTIPHFPIFCFLRSLQHELFSSFSCWHFYVASLAVKNDNECFFFSLPFFSLSSLNIHTIGKTSSVCEFCKSSLSIFCYCDFSSTYHHPLQQASNKWVIEPKPNPYLNAIFHGGNYAVTPFSLFYWLNITDWLADQLTDWRIHSHATDERTDHYYCYVHV